MRAAGAWSSAARCWSTAIASPGSAPTATCRLALRGRRRARSRRRARHAGPGRLPHPPGLRRPPRARVRAAPAGRQLRGHRPRRRRHPLDRRGDARGERRRPVRRRPRARAGADGRRRDHGRDQVGLRPVGSSTRRAACASPAGSARELPLDGADDLPRRRTRCRPSSRAAPTTTSTPSAPGCRRCTPRAWSMPSTPSAIRIALHAGADAARLRRRARARPAGQAARRAAQRPARRRARRRATARCRCDHLE